MKSWLLQKKFYSKVNNKLNLKLDNLTQEMLKILLVKSNDKLTFGDNILIIIAKI